jgi:hypothetical protein
VAISDTITTTTTTSSLGDECESECVSESDKDSNDDASARGEKRDSEISESNESTDSASEAVKQLQELQDKMQMALQSSIDVQQSHEKKRQQRLEGHASPDALVWQNLALELELEEMDREEEEESTSGNTTPRALSRSHTPPLRNQFIHPSPNPNFINHDTLEERESTSTEHASTNIDSEVTSDDRDCHALPVIVSKDPEDIGLKYTPKKGMKGVTSTTQISTSSFYVRVEMMIVLDLLNVVPELIFFVLQEEQVPRTEQVQKEGFLLKRGFVNTAFKRRWCVLR